MPSRFLARPASLRETVQLFVAQQIRGEVIYTSEVIAEARRVLGEPSSQRVLEHVVELACRRGLPVCFDSAKASPRTARMPERLTRQ